MEQNIMKVKCPNSKCGAVMTIPNAPGIADRMLTCPICKYRDKVSVFIAEMNKTQEDDSTELCLSDDNAVIGLLEVNGAKYPLKEGRNTVGRKAVSSTADVQLYVNDMHMSRQHICISVMKRTDNYQHRLENITSNNSVSVNGNVMKAGEIIILKFGDVIQLGKTEVHFVKP